MASPNVAGVLLSVLADGHLLLRHSWTEMGQGIHTALRQIVAHELGLAPERIDVVVDTERELDTGETTASRATLAGRPGGTARGGAVCKALEGSTWSELVGREFEGEYLVDWTTPIEAGVPDPHTHIAYGWATQVVILDADGRLERVIAAQDVGRAINRQVLEGQVEGGVHMGLGYALTEEFVVEDGRATDRDAQVARHHSRRGHAQSGCHPRRGAAAGGSVRREGRRRSRARAHRGSGGRRPLRVRRHPPARAAHARFRRGARLSPPTCARAGRSVAGATK